MRNISFMLTTAQIEARTKTVTRRLGWAGLEPGDLLRAVVKSQGLGKGGKVEPLGVIRVESARRERLDAMADDDCAREGFPEMGRHEFVNMFCQHMRCDPDTIVTRIEFSYVDEA